MVQSINVDDLARILAIDALMEELDPSSDLGTEEENLYVDNDSSKSIKPQYSNSYIAKLKYFQETIQACTV